MDWLLNHYRVILFDQRGTGASSPIDSAIVTAQGDSAAQADYLACFRADAIIDDAEQLRQELQGDKPWHVLWSRLLVVSSTLPISHGRPTDSLRS